MEYFLCGILTISALAQGGFYPSVFLLCGVLLAAGPILTRKAIRFCAAEFALWLFALFAILASLQNGYSSSSLAQACLPLCCASFLTSYRTLSSQWRNRVLQAVVLLSGVFAGAGILALCGLAQLPGAVVSRRLQFPFQYANAAGSWFAAAAVLSQDEKGRLRAFQLPILAALFLTRSTGALGVYALCQILRLWWERKTAFWKEMVLIHGIAALFAFGFSLIRGIPALALLLLLYAAGFLFESISRLPRQAGLHWIGLLLIPCGAAALFLTGRSASPLATFAERLVQILDGAKLIGRYPLWGVGAGNWEAHYPYMQSAQYDAAVVHSWPVQIGVDAGIPALLAFAAFLFLSWRRGKRTQAQTMAAALLCVHSLLDFTMQFFPLAALLISLLFADEKAGVPSAWFLSRPSKPLVTGERNASPSKSGPVVFHFLLPLAAGALCAVMLWGETQYKRMAYAFQRQDWKAAASFYCANQPFFGKSRDARELCVRALALAGDREMLVALTEDVPDLSVQELLLRAQALRELGEEDGACALLMEALEQRPFCVSLYEETAALLTEWDADPTWFDTYNRFAQRGRDPGFILANLMGNQVKIAPIHKN